MSLSLVNQLKSDDQDFEWYPTTAPMIAAVARKITKELDISRYGNHIFSLLDIGAGDGRIFGAIEENIKEISGKESCSVTPFAIEKSQKLISLMPNDVVIVGTDFLQQSLLDKEVDVIFCNPPYSEFEAWAAKIILEGNARHAFLVIPQRWKDSPYIKDAIKRRKIKASVIFSGDFLAGERSARAKIDIVHLDFDKHNSRHYGGKGCDPFDLWFEEHFIVEADKHDTSEYETEEKKREEIRGLIVGRNPVEVLAELYRKDMEKLIANYQAVCDLDPDILRELAVNREGLREGMKGKIKGLKSLYWRELFDNLEAITDRLTSETRESFVRRFNSNTAIDFSESNAYAVVLWAIKNANSYIDAQVVSLFRRMTCEENAVPYKSNVHMTKDTWRYARWGDDSAHSHYKLDYRIVLNNYYAIGGGGGYSWEYKNNLHESSHKYIGDVFTVAKNLGFNVSGSSWDRHWESNQAQDFELDNGDLFGSVRCFKNGNIHMKLSQKFMAAFNIEAARLLGWIKSPEEAAKEMEISLESAQEVFGKTFKFEGKRLLSAFSN